MAVGTVHNVTINYMLAIVAIWGAVTVFFQSAALTDRLYQDASIGSLLLLPIPDEVIFRWQGQTFLWRSLAIGMDGVAAFTFLAISAHLPPNGWIVVPLLATAHWAMVLALAVASAAHPVRALSACWPLIPVLFVGGFLLFVDKRFIGPQIAGWIDASSHWLTLLLPTGWTATVFDRALVKQEWLAATLAAPMLLILVLGVHSWRRLRQNYSLNVTDSPPDLSNREAEDECALPPRAPSAGPTEVLEAIHAREFLYPAGIESGGLLERIVSRRFTARDKLLTETMSSEVVHWSQRWRKAAWIMAGGMLASWLVQKLGQGWFGWIDGFTLLVSAGLSLSTGIRITAALPGLLPTNLGEMTRLKTKIALVRCLSALPLFAIYGALLAWRLGEPPLVGASVGAKVITLLLAVVPFHVVASISSGTNDTKINKFRALWMILVLLGCVAVILGLGAAAIIADFAGGPLWIGWACVPGVAVTSWLFFAYYQRQFNRCRFDLIRIVPAVLHPYDDDDGEYSL